MFGNDKQAAGQAKKNSSSSLKDGGVTILTAGCHFSGKLYCKGATRIGGTIDGEIIAEGVLIVEEDATINANVKAEEIVVHGRIEGQINVNRKIELCSTSDVQADLNTPNLMIHSGATFNGRTTMKRAATSSETNSKDGKSTKDIKGRKAGSITSETEKDLTTGIAARIPDISFT